MVTLEEFVENMEFSPGDALLHGYKPTTDLQTQVILTVLSCSRLWGSVTEAHGFCSSY